MSEMIANASFKKHGAFQQILIDGHGLVLENTGSLLSLSPSQFQRPTQWSAFFESIFEALLALQPDSPEIFFSRVESISDFALGCYDCSFLKVQWGEKKQIIVWTIYERSEEYQQLQLKQQRLNEMRMKELH